jgi:general secretion pathway protein J
LLEIIVAVAIFAVMSAVAYQGLGGILAAREHLAQQNHKWRDLAMFFVRFEADIDAMAPRTVRDSFDQTHPALEGMPVPLHDEDPVLALTRMGLPGQNGVLASVQRFGYRLRGNTLEQLVWTAPDQAPRTQPAVNLLLDHISAFEVTYLDLNRQWQPRWPTPDQQGKLPLALNVAITLESGERANRVIAVPIR